MEPTDDRLLNCPPDAQTDGQVNQGAAVAIDVGEVVPGCAYAGTSGHTVHKRMHEHAQSVWRKDGKSALSKHHKDKHPEVTFNDLTDVALLYEASVTKGNFKFNTQRYICESLKIENINNDPHTVLLNGKSEWGNNKVRRLQNG